MLAKLYMRKSLLLERDTILLHKVNEKARVLIGTTEVMRESHDEEEEDLS